MAQSPFAPGASGFRRKSAELNLIPLPDEIHMKGAPFRTSPGLYLHIPTETLPGLRQRAKILADQLTALGARTQLSTTTALSGAQGLLCSAPEVLKQFGQMGRSMRDAGLPPSGYRLNVTSEGIFFHARDEDGFFYAGQTIRQLHEDGKDIPGMEIEDGPRVRYRGVHLDFRGWQPTNEYLEWTIDQLAKLKFNVLILEYANHFEFGSQPGVAGKEAFPGSYIADLDLFAKDRGIQLIPLLNCIGNQEYLLKLEPYRELREDPRYLQQFCPNHPSTAEIQAAMSEDLLAAHSSPYFHVGADGARFLGICPSCKARAKEVGGRSSLLLEYLGKICRYLNSRGKTVMIWNERFARMTDEQLRWLPRECIFAFHEFGADTEEEKTTNRMELERYRAMNRPVWASTSRAMSSGNSVFDKIDQCAEAAETGMLEGMILTSETRERGGGPLAEPPELTWPAVYYMAERAWAGRNRVDQDELKPRLGTRLYGVQNPEASNRVAGIYDLINKDYPREARRYLRHVFDASSLNQEMLLFLDAWCRVQSFLGYTKRFEEAVAAQHDLLQNGEADPFHAGRLRWRIEELKSRAPEILKSFRSAGARICVPAAAEEFMSGRMGFALQMLDDLEDQLRDYPLPDEEWQQPVHV